jgi:alkylhydroperoxidase family enzyme
MSNYHKIDFHDACDELRSVYQDVQHSMGTQELPNWLTYMGEMPHIVKGSWALLKSILVEGKLTPLLQDLIMYTVAYHRTVPYCMALHGANLIRMTQSLSLEDLEDIARGQSRGFIPQKYETALAIAAKLATSDCNLNEQDYSVLVDAGFDRQEALEVTMLVSVAVFFNTYTFAANLPVDEKIAAQYERKLST